MYHAQSRLEIHAMKKANKQVKKVGISAMNKMSLFMLVTSHVQSFNATQQKKTTGFSCPATGIVLVAG